MCPSFSYYCAIREEENIAESVNSKTEEKLENDSRDVLNVSSILHKMEIIEVNNKNKIHMEVKNQEDSNAKTVNIPDEKMKKTEDFRIVRGTFHQGNTNIFSVDSVGRQCTANAAAAILMASIKAPESWKSTDVNSVLITGDLIYQQSIANRPPQVMNERNSMYLNALEVKPDISFDVKKKKDKSRNIIHLTHV